MSDPETVGEVVAETIEHAIETAQENAEHAAETAEHLAEAALEGERGRRIADVERRLDEWQQERNETAEAIASLTLGMTQLMGQMQVLLAQSTQAPAPTQNSQSEREDGQQENPVPAEVVEPVAEVIAEPAPAPEAPKRKKHRWI